MQIAIVGTRHQPSAQVQSAIRSILRNAPAGYSFLTGCCTGVDAAVRHVAPLFAAPLTVFPAGSRDPAALRARSLKIVQACTALFSFPCSTRLIRSGSWLYVKYAAQLGKPCFVFLLRPVSSFPLWSVVSGWQPAAPPFPLPGLQFFSPVCSSVQLALDLPS